MRKFKHLAQLSDEELKTCLHNVYETLQHLRLEALKRDESGLAVKDILAEYRHQQNVYKQLCSHASLRPLK